MAWYHRWTSKILGKVPWLHEKLTVMMARDVPVDVPQTPWTPVTKNPFESRLMFITSGGVHTPDQQPFDMEDSRGDASFRWIPRDQRSFEITHDYYDHGDADEDLNCLFPLPLARLLAEQDLIGELVNRHLSFMGHIEDPLLPKLVGESLPKMWDEMADPPDLVLLSPG